MHIVEKLELAVAKSNTDSVTPKERIDYWAELTRSYQGRLSFEFPGGGEFNGHISRFRSERYQLIGWESEAVNYTRSARDVRLEPDESCRFVVTFGGNAEFWDGEQYREVPTGVGSVVSYNHPFGFRVRKGVQAGLFSVARSEITDRMDFPESEAGRPVNLKTGLGPMVTDMVGRLMTVGDSLSADEFDIATSHLLDLLGVHVRGQEVVYADRIDELGNAIRHHVRAHAADPDLCTASIARSLGWSVRQIQVALQRSGTTPRELIREERLRLAKQRLSDHRFRDQSISTMALTLGFGSAAGFSKTFRRRFDATPSEIRSAAPLLG